jgi:ABC-2 type transport system permease protein
VLGVTLYIIACTFRNRLRRWLMRFREPKYLMFALAGAAYLIFLLVLRLQTASVASGPDAVPSPIDQLPILAAVGPTLAGLAFMTVAAGSWLFPGGGLLRFTRAEVQFLFPGPFSRRTLVVHRMLRAQLGLLFGSFVSVVVLPSASATARLRIGLTLWVLLFTAKVYFAGVTVTRARMVSTDPRERFTGRMTIAVIVGAFLVVAATLALRFYSAPVVGLADALERLAHSTLPIVVRVLLWPFAALARPLFASDWLSFLGGFASACGILVIVSTWVMTADNTFERVATEPGLLQTEDGRKRPAYATRRASWQLAANGQLEIAFAWKAAVQTFRIVDRRVLIRVIAIITWLAVVVVSSNRGRGLATIAGLFATTAVAMAVLIGPLTLRLDFREDLRHLEVLKTWPVPGAAAIRGMLLWPTVLLTAAAWTMTLLAWLLGSAAFPE